MMKCSIDLCIDDSSVCASIVHVISYRYAQSSINISLLKFKLMILKFALTETFSANICNICITSMVYVLISHFLKRLLQWWSSSVGRAADLIFTC